MNIPSRKECFRLIKEMKMMDHIIDHSIMVSNVALFLSQKLKKHAPTLNTQLTTSAALLHDITKTRSFKTREIHSETGAIILTRMGYPEVGEIIRQHVVLDVYTLDTPVTEPEIVNYADKRILHNKVVSLDQRMEYILMRYCTENRFKARFQIMRDNTVKLEQKIFTHLDISPDQLADCILQTIQRTD